MTAFLRMAAFCGFALLAAHNTYAETVIKAVMHSPLRMSDPHATAAYISTWHGYMIYDTLLATDTHNQIQPQMLESWQVSDDGKTYTLTLRPGLKWHDETPVTARDCITSIEQWVSGDIMGRTLLILIETMYPIDERHFRIAMKEPTDLALRALAKPTGTTPFMMPERLTALKMPKEICWIESAKSTRIHR